MDNKLILFYDTYIPFPKQKIIKNSNWRKSQIMLLKTKKKVKWVAVVVKLCNTKVSSNNTQPMCHWPFSNVRNNIICT